MPIRSSTLLPPITVLGAGAFGTALAIHLARRQPVRLWGHNPEHMATLQRERANHRYLPTITFPSSLHCTAQLTEALQGVQTILIAIPSHALPSLFQQLTPFLTKDLHFLVATKGLYPRPPELLSTWLDTLNLAYTLLSGPSFAKEVAQGLPVAWVLASRNLPNAFLWKERLYQPNTHISHSEDVIGVALYSAMKNIVAVAVGLANGLDLGENTQALLLTQGLAEMQQLGSVLGATTETLTGPAGIGDLSLTCTSNQSRNRRLGITMGQGASYIEATKRLGLLSEGATNTRTIYELAIHQKVTLPLCKMVYTILFDQLPPKEAISNLMNDVTSYVST